MATHSSVLAWRIPGTGEPSGLRSMGSHRIEHDWSDAAAAAAAVWGKWPFDESLRKRSGRFCILQTGFWRGKSDGNLCSGFSPPFLSPFSLLCFFSLPSFLLSFSKICLTARSLFAFTDFSHSLCCVCVQWFVFPVKLDLPLSTWWMLSKPSTGFM